MISATSTLIIAAREKKVEIAEIIETAGAAETSKDGESGKYQETHLAQVPCIWYFFTFWRKSVLALFNSRSKVSAIHLIFAKEIGLPIRPTDIKA